MLVGMDLGTTNSSVGVFQDGQARLIPNALGSVLTPSCVSLDADGSVLVGQAGLKARDQALAERVMTDVAPYTLGIEIVREDARGHGEAGHYLPVIERNTVIPASRVERVWPTHPRQRKVEITVFQGEARRTADNIRLGRFTLPLRSSGAEDERGVDVRFTYDTNGILEVTATGVADGAAARLVIQEGDSALPPEEVERRLRALDALKVHPRDRAEHRALLARAGRLYEELLGDARAAAGQAAMAFEAALDTQDPRAIEAAARELAARLDRWDRDTGW